MVLTRLALSHRRQSVYLTWLAVAGRPFLVQARKLAVLVQVDVQWLEASFPKDLSRCWAQWTHRATRQGKNNEVSKEGIQVRRQARWISEALRCDERNGVV